jgi:hypothetical protein
MLDDVEIALPGENPSAEVRMAAIVHAYELEDQPCTVTVQNPSAEGFGYGAVCGEKSRAEVREERGMYRAHGVAA